MKAYGSQPSYLNSPKRRVRARTATSRERQEGSGRALVTDNLPSALLAGGQESGGKSASRPLSVRQLLPGIWLVVSAEPLDHGRARLVQADHFDMGTVAAKLQNYIV